MTVILAEKPSVARDLARCLGATQRRDGFFEGGGYQVTWAYGHLVTLKEPGEYDQRYKRWRLDTLPIIPPRFELKVINTKLARKQFKVVTGLFKGASSIVCATDAGREGELIFRHILQLSGCARKPFTRLWLSSMTDQAIRAGMNQLRDGRSYDPLFDAARCRSEADWIVGLNATRNYTIRHGGSGLLWSVGRVQTPVLAMIAERDSAISNFVPERFWELRTCYRGAEFVYKGDRFTTEKDALAMYQICDGQPLRILTIRTRKENERPPQLFDLTELQRHMNRRMGLSAAATLEVAQELYEQKLVTYPRTDSRYLSSDMKAEIPKTMRALEPLKPTEIGALDIARLPYGKRVINDQKVTDHHAIIPTGKSPAKLSPRAAAVYDAILLRFIAAFYPACEKLKTTVEAASPPFGSPHVPFVAKGTQIVVPGWRALYPRRKTEQNTTSTERAAKEPEPQLLPAFVEGEEGPHEPAVRDGLTKPPKPYNESSLLSAMETCGRDVDDEQLREALKEKGLGTPATRAQIIETLLTRGYIERRKRNLHVTPLGQYLISLISSPSLKSAELTGTWEEKLKAMERGQFPRQQFMREIATYIDEVIRANDARELDDQRLGPCPCCGKDVIKGRQAYGCSGWREGCKFVLPPNYKGKVHLSLPQIRELLQFGHLMSPVMFGQPATEHRLYLSAAGTVEAAPRPEAGQTNRRQNPRRRSRSSKAPARRGKSQAPPSADELGDCPLCQQSVVDTDKAYRCRSARGSCSFVIWKTIAGKRISSRTVKTLLKNGKTSVLKGFKAKSGKTFSASLKVADGKVVFDFG